MNCRKWKCWFQFFFEHTQTKIDVVKINGQELPIESTFLFVAIASAFIIHNADYLHRTRAGGRCLVGYSNDNSICIRTVPVSSEIGVVHPLTIHLFGSVTRLLDSFELLILLQWTDFSGQNSLSDNLWLALQCHSIIVNGKLYSSLILIWFLLSSRLRQNEHLKSHLSST